MRRLRLRVVDANNSLMRSIAHACDKLRLFDDSLRFYRLAIAQCRELGKPQDVQLALWCARRDATHASVTLTLVGARNAA